MSPFATLGLEENADERQIKRAYAVAIRRTRPDEDPAGFQRINEAYRAALKLAQVRERAAETGAPGARLDDSLDRESPRPKQTSSAAGQRPTANPARPSDADSVPPQQIAREVLGKAQARPSDVFAQWLRDYPPLYSLERKHEAAIALVPLLIPETTLPVQTLDAISDFFDLEALGTHPPHIHSMMRAARSLARLDYPTFCLELERRCHRSKPGELKCWLYAQEELHDPYVRRNIGKRVHSWLTQDELLRVPPPLMTVLVEFFGYDDARLLNDRTTALWAIETEDTSHWGERSQFPIQQLKRRFGLLFALAIAVAIPGMPQRIARIAKRLIDSHQGLPAQIDAGQYRFFTDFASTAYFGRWRWIAIFLRGALGIAAAMIAQVVLNAPNDRLFLSIPAMVVGANLLVIFIDYRLLQRSRRTGARPR